MSSAPEKRSATAEDEGPKVDTTDTHPQSATDGADEAPEVDSTDTHSQNAADDRSSDDQPNDQGQTKNTTSVTINAEPAKKTRKRGGGGKKKNKPTGFEEFFCEPPMTPDEHELEKTVIYAPSRPFVDRIEECIQRFRARRRMGNNRDLYFSQYLALGGVNSTGRQFQSTRKLGDEELEGLSKAEVREITADDVVQRGTGSQDRRWYNPENPEHWEVDFAGVAAGFCSVGLKDLAISDKTEYITAVDTVYNFLKYIDLHDVCPEYTDDVKKAQRVCETALEEIPSIVRVSAKLPGRFNTAAALVFCRGDSGDFHLGWDDENEEEFNDESARLVFGASIAILLDQKLGDSLVSLDASVVDTDEGLFEIVKISMTEDAHRPKFQAMRYHLKHANGTKIDPCGFLTVRPTHVPDGWDNEINAGLSFTGEQTFPMEEDLLEQLKVGQMIQMTVCTMNSGFKFIKKVMDLRPTFYTFLPQSLMIKFKEPIPDTRPAPSIHSANLQEEILADIPFDAEGDGEDWE